MMHKITQWEASRSGAGITIAMTDAGNVRRKQLVKKIEAKYGSIIAYGGDGTRFPLTIGRETSEEVASIAGDLSNIRPRELTGLPIADAELLALKIRKVAASALGQHA